MFEKGFPQDTLITYSGMLWLLAAQITVMLPLMFYLPIWLLPVLIFSAVWRIRAMRGHTEQPGKLVKASIGVLGIAALFASGLSVISLDMMASLLMFAFAYKAIEVIQRRDGMVVILTGFILIGVLFLYNQSMLITLYGVGAMAVLTGAMIAIHQAKSYAILPNLKLASLMLLLCLPLMLLLFFFAPRFEPLWVVPLSSSTAKTGISDSMTPGDIARLSQSDDLAFSVKFDGERPEQHQLYWRGLVLDNFDGKTWGQFNYSRTQSPYQAQQVLGRLEKRGEMIDYEVIYEQSGQPWLFALTPVVDIDGRALFAADNRIIARQAVNEPLLLTLTSYPDALRSPQLSDHERRQALQLPDGGNQESRVLAQTLWASSASQEDYIQRVLQHFRHDDYYYTLRPPLLQGADTIDQFLINSKRGFCSHYSGSFVFMMRAVGIPARVVVGYQGGEWNEEGQFLAVHQFDAHAWTEVWLDGQGWVRHDPTSMVAPSRIEQNLETAMQDEGSFLEDNLLSLSKVQWLNGVRKKMASIQYAWRRHVLGFDRNSQQDLFGDLFGGQSLTKLVMMLGGVFAGIVLMWAVFLGLFRKKATEAIEHQLYRRFCELLAKRGVRRELSHTPEIFGRLAMQKLPALAADIRQFTQAYTRVCYDPAAQDSHRVHIGEMRALLKKIQRSVRSKNP